MPKDDLGIILMWECKRMSLAERRAIQAFQAQKYPDLKAEISAAAGFDVTIEVQWETLAAEGQAHLYEEAFTNIYFHPLIAAIQAVCVNDAGRSALKSSLKTIVISDMNQHCVTFEYGTLSISYPLLDPLDHGLKRQHQIQSILESGLQP
jgi:hypothetical protein